RLFALDVVDEMRLRPHTVVRDCGVHGRELNRRHRNALADRHVADRRAGPVRRQQARTLAWEVDAGLLTEAELVDPLLQPSLTEEVLRDRHGADVRRALENL